MLFRSGFDRKKACTGDVVSVKWTGYHNIQETNTSSCQSNALGSEIVGFHSSGYEKNFTANELTADPGQTRYFKCTSHCGASSARFEIYCPKQNGSHWQNTNEEYASNLMDEDSLGLDAGNHSALNHASFP